MSDRIIELLAPARDYDAGRAAVDFGADALYVGGARFGARAAAGNTAEQIGRLVRYARRFGVRVYAALNTLLYEEELQEAERTARELVAAGVDALIVQDMAFLRMGLQGVEFHASTQTQNMTPEKVRFLETCGFSRVILERGLTLEQIRDIRAASTVSLEAFVHGAICVGYSGRCYLSRTAGPRSGNRGDCAQLCRMTYDLKDGRGEKILRNKHLLSLRDLDLSARIPELLAAGVDSFKIEGRLKDMSYVKNIVAHYRRELDAAMAGGGYRRASEGVSTPDFEPDPSRSFTRGATTYYYDGKARGAASFDTPKAVGNYVGRVAAVDGAWFALAAGHGLAPGDGICFLAPDGTLSGTNVNRVEGVRVNPNRMEGIERGVEVYRNYDHRFTSALAASRTRRVVDVTAAFEFRPGGMRLTLTDDAGQTVGAPLAGARIFGHPQGVPLRDRTQTHQATVAMAVPDMQPANDPERMVQTVRAQIAKSGDMPFAVTEVTVTGPVGFAPVSALNALRREAMEQLLALREASVPPREIGVEDVTVPYPGAADGYLNVTNSLAERFYRDHGVQDIAPGFDLGEDFTGMEAMRTPYCLRREIGQCLREKHTLDGALLLAHGHDRYRLGFDCEKCEMTIIYERS